jgi:hypothetical protein
MFLHFFKYLYKRQPKLFYLFGSFFIIQVFLSLIKLEVTPFFLYGMFSEKVIPSDTLVERSIWVNGKQLKNTDLFHKEHLLLEETAKKYVLIKKNHSTDIVQSRVEQKYGFLTQLPVYPFLRERIYNKAEDIPAFEHWFKETCKRLAQKSASNTFNESLVLHKYAPTITIKEDTYIINPGRTELKQIKSEVIYKVSVKQSVAPSANCVFGALISLVINYFSAGMIHQVSGNLLVDQEIDSTYWLAMILQPPATFRGAFAITLDSVLSFPA